MRTSGIVRAGRRTLARLGGLFRHGARERELAAEIESHLALHIDDNLRRGLTPDEARRQARLALGGEAMKEAYRDQGTVPFVEHTVQDIRLALRQLAKSPGLAATAILVLALGMGGCLTVFGFVEAALLRPLPYAEPDRLVDVMEANPQFPRSNLSYQDFRDWQSMNTVFSSLDAYRQRGHMLATPGGPVMVPGMQVSGGFFRTLGIQPDPRPRLQRRRVRRRGRQGRGHHASDLAGALRRRSDGGRPQRHAERRQLRHHRRPAADVPVRARAKAPSSGRRSMPPAAAWRGAAATAWTASGASSPA